MWQMSGEGLWVKFENERGGLPSRSTRDTLYSASHGPGAHRRAASPDDAASDTGESDTLDERSAAMRIDASAMVCGGYISGARVR